MKQLLLLEIDNKIKTFDSDDVVARMWWGRFRQFIEEYQPKKVEKVIKIHYKDDTHWNKRGVYIIWFGERYYVGRSKLLSDRKKQHEKAINLALMTPDTLKEVDFYYPIIVYLLQNPQISDAFIEIVQECETNDDLLVGEQRWLTKSEGDPNCLNKNFIAKRPWNEKEETVENQMQRPGVTTSKWGKKSYYKRTRP